MTIKSLGKSTLCKLLESQVRRLREKREFTVITVGGSVGKTSTKLAVATLLSSRQKVCYQDGNYNDRLTVPLVLFGHSEPAIYNMFAWCKILLANEQLIRRGVDYEIAVLELGTDGPGQMTDFAYLKPDIFVLTAVAAEHMEFFDSLDAVAAEELVMLHYAKTSIVNIDDVAPEYLQGQSYIGYGQGRGADYRLVKRQAKQLLGQIITINPPDRTSLEANISLLGVQGAKIATAAAAVAFQLGWRMPAIKQGLGRLSPVAGRMQVLAGIKTSILLDDTYNASPVAVKAALDTLYSVQAPQHIAILGTMNELGDSSADAHAEVGTYCDPKKMDLVVTIGQMAREYTVRTATRAGCRVVSFDSPYEAGEYVLQHMMPGAVILAKGSQNGVFAEEALKPLLRNPDDAAKLVRQSEYWLGVKQRQFPR